MKHIGIIACGWFGMPLATSLLAQGYRISGTKRTEEGLAQLHDAGIKAYRLDLDEDLDEHLGRQADNQDFEGLFAADMLVINIPPGLRRGESRYLAQLNKLKQLMGSRDYERIVFISTTGVYPASEQDDTKLTEDKALAHSEMSDVLLQAEALFAGYPSARIVRFAGLVGPKRHPGRFFGGKTDISGANVAVNLVHLDDCIKAVSLILSSTHLDAASASGLHRSAVYNLAAPIHPSRGEFYPAAALALGLGAPEFNQQKSPNKIINGQLICQELGFEYTYNDPMKMLSAC